jgi:DnaJ-class molecular chaperone
MPTEVTQDILDLSAGIIGGSFGVVGTLVALEFKKMEVRERAQCPYCIGTGQLTCATCLGCGVVTSTREDGVAMQQSCPDCEGTGYTTCINCKGDGRLVPTMLDTSVSRDPESELDDIGMT